MDGGVSGGQPTSEGGALPRTLLSAAYRLLPGIAMAVAGLAIVVTLVEVAGARGRPRAAAPSSVATSPASAPVAVSATVPGPSGAGGTPAGAQTASAGAPPAGTGSVAAGTAVPAAQAPAASVPAAARPSSSPVPATPPPPTASPVPPVTMQASPPNGGSVRVEGRVVQPAADVDYWFLIREPGREGVFRQGPAILNPDGSFSYLLSLTPLDTGPDSVTVAAIPKDTSLAWTRLALSTGAYLPVVDVQPNNGIRFLQEVRLQPKP